MFALIYNNDFVEANSQQPTANSQQPTANSQQPTANSQQPTANSQHVRILNFLKNHIYTKSSKYWDILIYPLIKIRKIINRIFVCGCYLINSKFSKHRGIKCLKTKKFQLIML